MSKLIKFTFISLFLVVILVKCLDDDAQPLVDYQSPDCTEEIKTIKKKDSLYSTNYIQRSWLDYNRKDYCYDYSINEREKINSRSLYDQFTPSRSYSFLTDALFFGDIYKFLYETDKELLIPIADSLYKISQQQNLDRKETAELIVSFVQDIPYSYVFSSTPCSSRPNKEHPCTEGHYFGLLTPLDFMHTLIGDCDTRSVLLYTLLKQLKYDVSIVISYEYEHAMIAINLPYQGDYISYKGNKYYFWETTNVDWLPGVMPPDCKNINYWKIALN